MRTDTPGWTNLPGPGASALQVLRRESGRWWWVPLVAGVIWFVIAWLTLRMNITSLVTVGVLVGLLLLLAAVNEAVIAMFVTGGWRAAHYVLTAVFVLGAAWAFARPINTFFALASVLGLLLFLQGALYIARGIGMRGVSPYWGLELLGGVGIALLAFWVSMSDRYFGLEGRTVFILIWVGFMALFRGFSGIVLAFSMLWFAKKGDGGQPDRADGGTTRPVVVTEKSDGRATAEASQR